LATLIIWKTGKVSVKVGVMEFGLIWAAAENRPRNAWDLP